MQSNFIIYNASAGSGKTYTITKEYLKILFNSSHLYTFKHILAITFTNKAASELKNRILNALIGFSGVNEDLLEHSLLDQLAKETNLTYADIQKKSLLILKRLISNYADFEVSTIDSFNQRIIRTFARDLKISQHFSIQLDTDNYLQQAVDQLIEGLGLDDQLTKWLIDFVQFKMENETSGDIRYTLKDYAGLVLNENNYEHLAKLQSMRFVDLKAANQITKSKYEKVLSELNQLDRDFHRLLENNGIEESSFPYKTIPNYFKNIRTQKFQFAFKEEDIPHKSFCKSSATPGQQEKIDGVRPKIEKCLQSLFRLSTQFQVVKKVLNAMTPLAMISQVQQKLNALKAEEEVLFTNDFNRLIGSQVALQPAPFIYERLGEKFSHYFIDEFQDTSKLQWQNMIPLIDHALSSENQFSKESHLFLVGDVKQSIYEWRGGDAQLLLDLYYKNLNPFTIPPVNQELDKNWRSAKRIVEFNNQFFEYASTLLTDPQHKSIYQQVSQSVTKDKEGYIELTFIDNGLTKEALQEDRISQILRCIEKALEQGYTYSDICILIRTNKQGVEIAQALNNLETPIPVISQESLLIKNDIKVQIVHLLAALLVDFSDKGKFNFLMKWFSFTNLSSDRIDEMCKKLIHLDFYEFFSDLKSINIPFDVEVFLSLPFYNKVEYIIQSLGFQNNTNAYLQFYLDEVLVFSRTKAQDLVEFLTYWEGKKDKLSISIPEASHAIKIMTIHKSKGLQFPIVIYAYANFKLSALKNKLKDWVLLDETEYGIPLTYQNISMASSSLNEEFQRVYEQNVIKTELANINTAYVCMTRPEDQLYILVDPLSDSKNVDFRTMLENFLKSKNKFVEGQTNYNFGLLEVPKAKKTENKVEEFSSLSSFNTSRFLNTLSCNRSNIQNALEIEYGINLHKALENITYSAGYFEKQKDSDFDNEIIEILNHKILSIYYTYPWQIYNEVEIAHNSTVYRIDRLCIYEKEAVILDYKTGAESPKDIQQISDYKNAIESLGYTHVKAYLVYIRKSILVKSI